MAFVSSFAPTARPHHSLSSQSSSLSVISSPRKPNISFTVSPRASFSSTVDEFMASSVNAQYIALACPSGVSPIQCNEGTTSDEPYELRTVKRQAQLRYRQLPVNVRLRTFTEMRRAAVVAAHNCSHEESQVINYPTLASAYVLGQAEASRACSRYFFVNPDSADMHMARAINNQYMNAINATGTFSTVCSDGQAKGEAEAARVRAGSVKFRASQYSVREKEAMKYAARKKALAAKGLNCSAEEAVFNKFPAAASAMRPTFGYYPPFVKSPKQGYTIGVPQPALSPTALEGIASAAAAKFKMATSKTPATYPY